MKNIDEMKAEMTCSAFMKNGGILSEPNLPKILGWKMERLDHQVNASIGFLYQENGT
ncbi:hypothetical protein ACPV4W_00950 [Vibrio diabolicus]|uniref:hypothetical protein n=1 Tax=Vibrio diabolicus TaxID=50719 RepID=UPI002657C9D2